MAEESIMIWSEIIDGIIVGPWKMAGGNKMTSNEHFLRDQLEPWLKKLRINFKRTIIFKQDNALSHTVHKTSEYLQKFSFCGPRKINWLVNSADLNPIENLWGILMQQVHFVAVNSEFMTSN